MKVSYEAGSSLLLTLITNFAFIALMKTTGDFFFHGRHRGFPRKNLYHLCSFGLSADHNLCHHPQSVSFPDVPGCLHNLNHSLPDCYCLPGRIGFFPDLLRTNSYHHQSPGCTCVDGRHHSLTFPDCLTSNYVLSVQIPSHHRYSFPGGHPDNLILENNLHDPDQKICPDHVHLTIRLHDVTFALNSPCRHHSHPDYIPGYNPGYGT